MCTLIVLDRILPGVPLAGAFNRDEYASRPTAPPALLPPAFEGGIPLVAPQDLEAGGTWMGLNAKGLFVGLTNRPTAVPDSNRRSRGLLVLDALSRATATEALGRIQEDADGRYNPFHMVCADGRETHLVSLREEGLMSRRLDPGIHVLSNRDPEDPSDPKVRSIRERLSALDLRAPLDRVLERLREVLRIHATHDSPAVCVHRSEYGTRSSGVIALTPRRWQFWHADGPPCSTKYQNYTRLLDGLRQTTREESRIEENR